MSKPASTEPSVVLDAFIGCTRGDLRIDVPVIAKAGTLTALVGPNGAGKSTILRVLAGLLRLDAGYVRVDGVPLSDAAEGIHIATERRPIGMLFQDHLLFPSMTARDNIAFGLRAHGRSRADARAAADAALASIGLAHRAAARPAQLSGGEAQRVALSRALAVTPRLLLLDEPFAALDPRVRTRLRAELRTHVSEFDGATIVVTHDPLEALLLADQVIVVEAGQVVQAGPPGELARRPRTEYVARLAGLNLLRGTGGGTTTQVGDAAVVTSDSNDGAVLLAIRPNAISVHLDRPHGSPRNVWPARIAGVELHGDQVRLSTVGSFDLVVDVTPRAAAELALTPGSSVWLSVKATEVAAYPA